jgi:hypothetical protein
VEIGIMRENHMHFVDWEEDRPIEARKNGNAVIKTNGDEAV